MKPLLYLTLCFGLLTGCLNPKKEKTPGISANKIAAADGTADFLQLTEDFSGNLIAWWAETDAGTGESIVCFSKSPLQNPVFDDKTCIDASRKATIHAEGLPKLVIKPDNTYVLVFGRRGDREVYEWAGSIVYSQSFDGGETWAEATRIHSDNNPETSHAFSNAALTASGEVAAVWLDGRNKHNYSEVFFAQTEGKSGFGTDKAVGGPACECCKLSLYVDAGDKLHLVYRSLTGDNIRDIAHIYSGDNGASFTQPETVHHDDWHIIACPHNGPDITVSGGAVFVTWFTMGSGEGLYYAVKDADSGVFSERRQLTNSVYAKRPYLARLNNQTIAAVWDESFDGENGSYLRVKTAYLDENGAELSSEFAAPEGVEASMPGLFELKNGHAIVTWTQHTETGNTLHYAFLNQ